MSRGGLVICIVEIGTFIVQISGIRPPDGEVQAAGERYFTRGGNQNKGELDSG